MTGLPSGAVTFLFSDIEGSTRLVKTLRERYAKVLAEHRRLVRAAIADQSGHEVDTQGDAFFVAFAGAKQAVLCALEVQRVLARHEWPAGGQVRVRIGIHTGQAVPAEGAYTGLAVHRAARICAAARGGQVLVSQATQTLLEDEEEELGFALVDLGERKLKDLDRPVHLFQLAAPGLDTGAPPPAGQPGGGAAGGVSAARAGGAPGASGAAVILVFGDCELDLDRFELRRAGRRVTVEPQVFGLLAVLIRERRRVVPKEELLDTVWGNRFVSESALTSRVKAARQAIGDDGRSQRLIRTVHGRGYQFVAPVAEAARPGPAASISPAPPAQEIRFCTAGDGTRLAYATSGAGPPLVKAANWLSHLDYDWESPVWRHWLAELSRRYRLVRYDERGCGLSDWDIRRFSFEDWVDDLETVVDAAGLDRFPLLGISQGGPVAIAYAVRHPERVSHLVLLGAFAQGRRKTARTPDDLDLAEARVEIVRLGWGRPDPIYRQIFVARFLPEATQEQWRSFDELQRRSTSPQNAWRFVDEFANIDVTNLAPKLTVPTLIMCSRREPDNRFEQSRLLAALIPNSRLIPLDSSNHLLPEHDPAWQHFLAEIDRFLPGST